MLSITWRSGEPRTLASEFMGPLNEGFDRFGYIAGLSAHQPKSRIQSAFPLPDENNWPATKDLDSYREARSTWRWWWMVISKGWVEPGE